MMCDVSDNLAGDCHDVATSVTSATSRHQTSACSRSPCRVPEYTALHYRAARTTRATAHHGPRGLHTHTAARRHEPAVCFGAACAAFSSACDVTRCKHDRYSCADCHATARERMAALQTPRVALQPLHAQTQAQSTKHTRARASIDSTFRRSTSSRASSRNAEMTHTFDERDSEWRVRDALWRSLQQL